MDPVNPNASKALMRSGDASSAVVKKGGGNFTSVIKSDLNQAPTFTDLSTQVDKSTGDVRPDVVANAKKLLEDPEWLSDSNLENLSSKMLSIEDF